MEDQQQDMRQWYAIMNESSAFIRNLPHRKQPSQTTIKQYELEVKRMAKNNSDPISSSVTKNTYYKRRAAWCYIYERQAIDYLKKADKEKDVQKKILYIKRLQYCVQCIQKIPPDFERKNIKMFEKGEYESEWLKAGKLKQKSKSKKCQVSRLPKNWKSRYFEHLFAVNSKYLPAIAALSLSGCRPAELEKGIKISIKNNMLHFEIESAKTHGGKYGQKIRSFSIQDDSPEYRYLIDYINKNGESVLSIKSAKNLGEQMRKYSSSVFPSLKSYISPYTFRHSFAASIKSMLTDEGVAVAMGHSNDKSQRYYSNRKAGASSFSIDSINGTQKVKLVTRNNMHFAQESPSFRM